MLALLADIQTEGKDVVIGMLIVGLVYIGSIPWSIKAFLRLRRAAEELRAAGRGELLELDRERAGE